MFDTSVFNYIHEYDLYPHVESFFTRNKDVTVYVCDTQLLEVDLISGTIRKNRIKKLIQDISVQTVICSLAFVGNDKSSRRLTDRGFIVGRFKVAEMYDSKTQEMDELKRDKPDATILDTAITEEMDYLITRDKKMKTAVHVRLLKVRNYHKKYPELKIKLIKEKNDLMHFLNRLG
jgi:predicted nucleic acid-binding protein